MFYEYKSFRIVRICFKVIDVYKYLYRQIPKVIVMSNSFYERIDLYESLLNNRDLAVFVACVEGKAPSTVISIVLDGARGAAIKRRLRDREFKGEFLIDLPVAQAILKVLEKYGIHDYIECKQLLERLLHPEPK